MTSNALATRYSEQHISKCVCNGKGHIALSVALSHPLFGRAIPCYCTRRKAAEKRVARLRDLSGISDVELSRWTFEAFVPAKCVPQKGNSRRETTRHAQDILDRCKTYASAPQGWLILTGAVGSGKTHLAYAIASQVLASGMPVFVSPVPELLTMLRSGYKSDSFDKWLETIQRVALLVLDDLGAQRDTDWAVDTLYQVVNWRYAKRLPMVVTTNMDLLDVACPIDVRMRSRLLEGSRTERGWTNMLAMKAGDYRPRKGE